MALLRTIEVSNTCRRFYVPEAFVRTLFSELDRNGRFSIPAGELSVSFVSEKRIKALHCQFLHDPSLTDVITFAGDFSLDFAGEIVVCPECARRQSQRYATDLSAEIKLYLIHGFLHLSGLKDKSAEEAVAMRAAEAYCLDFTKNLPFNVVDSTKKRK